MKDYPLIKYVVAFTLGILASHYYPFLLESLIWMTVIPILLASLSYFTKSTQLITPIMLVVIVLSGFIYSHYNGISSAGYPFEKTKLSHTTLYGTVKDIKLINSNKFSLLLVTDSVIINDSLHRLVKNFQCNISFESFTETIQLYNILKIGNKIGITGTLRKGRNKRNPGEFNYYKYLQSKDISGLLYVKESKNVKIIQPFVNYQKNIVFIARKWIADKIGMLHNKRTSALLKGLLLADRSELDYRTKESFINSGVIHVLAVSGLHVGFIVIIFMFLFSRMPIYPRTFLTILGLVTFLLLTGSTASVFRATIMVVVMLLIYLSNRTYNSVNALAIAALILLLLDPTQLFNPGFQLSFSAVLSILLVYPILSKRITTQKKWLRYILLFSAVSFSAQLGTLPFTLIYFQKLSIISLFANLIVIPIIGIIVGLGVLTIFIAFFTTTFALFFASANMLATDILLAVVNFAGNQKFSYLFIPNFSIIDGIVFYIFFVVIIYSVEKFSNIYAFIFLIIFVGFNLFLFLPLDDKQLLPDGKFSVVMIDIGQGDGIFLKFPNGKTALVDAGNASPTFDNGERVIAPLLQRLSINKIDYGFISHVDSDHYKGFLSLIRKGWIAEIYKPPIDTTQKKDVRLEEVINSNNVKLHYYSKSKMVFGNLALYILNDTTNSEYNSFDSNNKSGILKIVHGNNSFLFVGDAEEEAEKILVKSYGVFLDSDVLKIGHHGSRSSSSEIFIDAVTPNIGLVSAGMNNSFGHPAKTIMDRYRKRDVKLYRTDIEGAVILQSDGEKITKINWREF